MRPTSVAAYAEGRARFLGRRGAVLRWLAAYWNRWQESPTSAELSQWCYATKQDGLPWDRLLYVRRGLSDLQTTGTVERVPAGDRCCRVTGHLCCTWRVTYR